MVGGSSQTSEPKAQSPDRESDDSQIHAMRQRLRELTFLHETIRILTATLDLDSVLQSLMTQVRDYFQVEAVSVALLDDETGELVFRVAVGEAASEVVGMRLAPGQGVAGWVAQTGEPSLVPVAHKDERFYSGVDDRTGFHTHSLLAVPITVEGRTIGVVEVLNPVAGYFDEDSQRQLLAMADLAAAAIHNAAIYERALQAERRYESLFNWSSDPVLVLGLEGEVLDLNQRAVETFGRSKEQVVGSYFCELFEDVREKGQAALKRALEGEQPTVKMRVTSSEGTKILEANLAKIDYGGREVIQWLGHDITERVALEHMRENLTHMLLHDLRNPLGSITGSLQLIDTAFRERDETLPVLELLRVAMHSGQKLYRLIDSLLDLGRLEAGEIDLNEDLVNPETLVLEAVEQIKPLTLGRGQTLTMQVPSGLPKVFAEGDMILRVLTNLLDNAVKFTPRGGHITLSVEQKGEEMLFTVSDTGPGIAPEHHQRVFDRFARLNSVEGVKGTGLGLAFCKLAAEAHGGRIWVESEMGKGSHFKFTLPLEREQAG
jgi:NtrC-family two-component system sensor histidine kinase KinB